VNGSRGTSCPSGWLQLGQAAPARCHMPRWPCHGLSG